MNRDLYKMEKGMTPLIPALEKAQVNLENFSELGKTTGFGTKTYLCFTSKDEKGWEVVKLNLIQRIFRRVLGWYKETRLENMYAKVSCEGKRTSLTKEQSGVIQTLRTIFAKKFLSIYTTVPRDWRITDYFHYAESWNAQDPVRMIYDPRAWVTTPSFPKFAH